MKFVFIIGDAAVGKMTVGQELMKITDLRLFHNHMTIEPVIEIFGALLLGAVFGTPLSTFWNVCLPNVSSQVLTCDGDAFSLAALALAPEEVVRRAKSPELIGTDTTKDIAGSDE